MSYSSENKLIVCGIVSVLISISAVVKGKHDEKVLLASAQAVSDEQKAVDAVQASELEVASWEH